jgi:hypothetical protein
VPVTAWQECQIRVRFIGRPTSPAFSYLHLS